MLTIYFNGKPLLLSNERNEVKSYRDNELTVVLDSFEDYKINQLIQQLFQPNVTAGVLFGDIDIALKSLQKQMHLIQAAGGLVDTGKNKFLLIFRRGKWDLPKGKLDEGEDLESCAVREVKEETGLRDLVMKQPLCITYHTYLQGPQLILKESHWYLMQADEEQELSPQTDEDIEICEWVEANQLANYTKNMHPSILDVLKKAIPDLKVAGV